MKIIHVCDGWEPTNGAAVIARMIAAEQTDRGAEVSQVRWASWRALRDADEVWVHCGWKPCLWWAAAVAKCAYWLPEGCYDPVRLSYHGWKKRLAGFVERFVLRRCHRIVATCPAERNWILTYLGNRHPEVAVTDVRRFFPMLHSGARAGRMHTQSLRVLYLGREHPLKGIEFLKRAVDELNADGGFKVELKALSKAGEAEKAAAFAECDLMCLPTLSDNFGLVVAEALSHGCPVVTTDGAPAWADEPRTFADGSVRMVYLNGYRSGSTETRVRLLKEALAAFRPGCAVSKAPDNRKILFVWTGVTSYMSDCWRELQKRDGVSLKVIVVRVASGEAFDAKSVLVGLDYKLVTDDPTAGNWDLANFLGENYVPDAVFAVGWHSRVVRDLVRRRDWAAIPKVCCFDMPWRWSLRCLAARFVLAPFLREYAAAYVPGRAAAAYARWLGFRKIEKGLFSIDLPRFSAAEGSGVRRSGFLYVGRFSSEKRVDLIRKAYDRYRELGGTWTLDMYGQGGKFVDADAMPELYRSHRCLVLASAFDPWPLVAVEAMASGCAVIMSDRCGNRLELSDVVVVPYGDVESLARAMLKEEGREDFRTPDLSSYGCVAWADRTLRLAASLIG